MCFIRKGINWSIYSCSRLSTLCEVCTANRRTRRYSKKVSLPYLECTIPALACHLVVYVEGDPVTRTSLTVFHNLEYCSWTVHAETSQYQLYCQEMDNVKKLPLVANLKQIFDIENIFLIPRQYSDICKFNIFLQILSRVRIMHNA